MGCAQGRSATRLRYAPTFYAYHFKPLQGTVFSTVPKAQIHVLAQIDCGSSPQFSCAI